MVYNFDIFPNRYKEKCRKWDESKITEEFGVVPKDYIPMWIADMDFISSNPLQQALQETIDIGVYGYTYTYNTFYETIQNYYQRHHLVSVDKEWITLCYGTVGALHNTVQAFCEKGDYVVLCSPVYGPFQRAIEAHGAICRTSKLLIDEHFRYVMDFDDIEQQLKTYQPKLFFLCNPHNPSGRVWRPDELCKLLVLCKKYCTIVVSDEVHSGMIYMGEFTSLTKYMNDFDNLIVLSSPNKQYNIGGLKTSYAIIKDKPVQARLISQFAKNSITSPSVFGIVACIACMKEEDTWSRECMEYIWHNYKYMCRFIQRNLPSLSYMKMESSYLLWINIQKTNISSDNFTRDFAKTYGVLVESGSHFVNHGEGWIRINLGTQFRNVRECCERMKLFLQTKEDISCVISSLI